MRRTRKNKKLLKTTKINTSPARLILLALVIIAFGVVIVYGARYLSQPSPNDQLESFRASPLSKVRVLAEPKASPSGIAPSKVKSFYTIRGENRGEGTIAIVNAYDNPRIERDLAVFSRQYNLPACNTNNNCFEKHKMANTIATNKTWALETALDVQWAHAIAPTAKILLVEARSNSGTHLLQAVDYALNRNDVVAVSLSWGGDEFAGEAAFNDRFEGDDGVTVFAASGDDGHGTIWPASTPNIVAVGGTTLRTSNGSFRSERAWAGSGGGRSLYQNIPEYQEVFDVSGANGKRAIPDVSYNANPSTGFPVYDSFGYDGKKGWFLVGGTSAGSPQWAAIHARGHSVTHESLYTNGASEEADSFFRDITLGNNGNCGFYCNTSEGYDYVTGLGSPRTTSF